MKTFLLLLDSNIRRWFPRSRRTIPAWTALCLATILAIAPASAQETSQSPDFFLDGPWIVKADWNSDQLNAADLNGDGLMDFVTVNNKTNLLEMYYQEKHGDERRFRKQEEIMDHSVTSLATADFNGDGRTSIAIASPDRNVVIRHQTSDGKLDREEPIPAQGFYLWGGDIDKDGNTDLIVLGDDKVMLFYGAEDVSFGAVKPQTFYNSAVPGSPLMVGDLDGNGVSDLAYLDANSRNRLLIRLQRSPRHWGLESSYEIADAAYLTLMRPSGGFERASLAMIDANTRELRLYRLNPGRQSNQPAPLSGPWALSFDPRSQTGSESLVAADLNGDGRVDLAAASPKAAEISLFPQSLEGRLDVKTAPSLSDIQKLVRIPREEGDLLFSLSDREETIGLSTWDEARGLAVPKLMSFDRRPRAMATGDLDGSGKQDLLFLFLNENEKIELGCFVDPKGPAVFDSSPKVTPLPIETEEEPVDLMADDLNGDGRCDLMVFTKYSPLRILLQNQGGDFTAFATDEGTLKGIFNNVQPSEVVVADLERDGRNEMLIAAESYVRAYRIKSSNEIELVEQFNGRNASSVISSVALADLDASGSREIVLLDTGTRALTIYGKKTSGGYELLRHHDIQGAQGTRLLVADANGDDRDDLVVYESGGIRLFYAGLPTPTFEPLWRLAPRGEDAKYARIQAAPLLSKGLGGGDQLLALEGTEHVLEIYRFAKGSPSFPEQICRFKVFDDETSVMQNKELGRRTEPRAWTTADVDGNGTQDLISLTHDNIIYYRQFAPGLAPTDTTSRTRSRSANSASQ